MARFVHAVHMRWSDMDAFRHINNSAYLAYLEQARVAMFFDRHEGFSRGTVISRHEIEYLRPVVYHPDPLQLELWVDQVRAASFVVHYEVFDAGHLVARASTQCVTFDFGLDRPRRLTPAERDVLAGYADTARAESTAPASAGSASADGGNAAASGGATPVAQPAGTGTSTGTGTGSGA